MFFSLLNLYFSSPKRQCSFEFNFKSLAINLNFVVQIVYYVESEVSEPETPLDFVSPSTIFLNPSNV